MDQQHKSNPKPQQFVYFNRDRSLLIEKLNAQCSKNDDSRSFMIHSYNVTFPNHRLVRVNIIQLKLIKQQSAQLQTILQSLFNRQQCNNINKQTKSIVSFCNNNNNSNKTTIRRLLHTRKQINNILIQQLAIRRLLSETHLLQSFSTEFMCGFDAVVIDEYVIYGDKCHLPLGMFLQQSIKKGYPFVNVRNKIKRIFEDLTHYHAVPVSNYIKLKNNQYPVGDNFWSIANFQYDITNEHIKLNLSNNENDCQFMVIKQDSQRYSPLYSFDQQQQQTTVRDVNSCVYSSSSQQEILICSDSSSNSIDNNNNTNSLAQQQQQHLTLNKNQNQKKKKIRYYNFFEQESIKCKQFLSQLQQTFFFISNNNNNKASSSSSSINPLSSISSTLSSTTTSNKYKPSPISTTTPDYKHSQHKDTLKHIEYRYCTKSHNKIAQLPLLVQQLLTKARVICLLLTSKSYQQFVNSYSRVYPKRATFNPLVVWFSQLKLSTNINNKDNEKDKQKDKKQSNSLSQLYQPHIQQMTELTQLLIYKYETEYNNCEYIQLLKHQKMILTMKVTHSCQADVVLQMIQFKMESLSIMNSNNSSNSSTAKQKSRREQSQQYNKSHNRQNTTYNSPIKSPLFNNNHINNKSLSIMSTNSMQRNKHTLSSHSSQQHHQIDHNHNIDYQIKVQQQYEYQNLPLWEEISIQRNCNNLQYGLKHNTNINPTADKSSLTTYSKSHIFHTNNNSKQHLNLQILHKQLTNQITHHKTFITQVQQDIILTVTNHHHQSNNHQKQSNTNNTKQLITQSEQDSFVNKSIISNLLILQFTSRVHFYYCILSRLPPLYNFRLSLYHIQKCISITEMAIRTIQQLKSSYTDSVSSQQQNKQHINSKQDINSKLNEFFYTFRQNLIYFLYQKINLTLHYLPQPIQSLQQSIKYLQNKSRQFYGSYHCWNIFIYLLKLQYLRYKHKYNHQRQQLNVSVSQQQPHSSQDSYNKKEQKLSQQLLQIIVKIKQIQYTNGHDIMLSFIKKHPRLGRKLLLIDKQLIKSSNKNSQTTLYLQQRLSKYVTLNKQYPSGLYKFNESSSSLQVINSNIQGNNNNNSYEIHNQGNYQRGECTSPNNLLNPFYRSNSPQIKSIQTHIINSLYYQQDGKLYMKLRQYLSQSIKQLDQIGLKKLTIQTIQSKLVKVKVLIQQHPLWQRIEGNYNEENRISKQRIGLITTKNNRRDYLQQDLVTVWQMVTVVETIYRVNVVLLSTQKNNRISQNINYNRQNQINQLREQISQSMQRLSLRMIAVQLLKYNSIELSLLHVVMAIKFMQLFTINELRTSHSKFLQKMFIYINNLKNCFKCYIKNDKNNNNYIYSSNPHLLIGTQQTTLKSLIQQLQHYQLFVSMLFNNKQYITNYYDHKLLLYSMNNYQHLYHQNQHQQIYSIIKRYQTNQNNNKNISTFEQYLNQLNNGRNQNQTVNLIKNQTANLIKNQTANLIKRSNTNYNIKYNSKQQNYQILNNYLKHVLSVVCQSVQCLPPQYRNSSLDLIIMSKLYYYPTKHSITSLEYLQRAFYLQLSTVINNHNKQLNPTKHIGQSNTKYFSYQHSLLLNEIISELANILIKSISSSSSTSQINEENNHNQNIPYNNVNNSHNELNSLHIRQVINKVKHMAVMMDYIIMIDRQKTQNMPKYHNNKLQQQTDKQNKNEENYHQSTISSKHSYLLQITKILYKIVRFQYHIQNSSSLSQLQQSSLIHLQQSKQPNFIKDYITNSNILKRLLDIKQGKNINGIKYNNLNNNNNLLNIIMKASYLLQLFRRQKGIRHQKGISEQKDNNHNQLSPINEKIQLLQLCQIYNSLQQNKQINLHILFGQYNNGDNKCYLQTQQIVQLDYLYHFVKEVRNYIMQQGSHVNNEAFNNNNETQIVKGQSSQKHLSKSLNISYLQYLQLLIYQLDQKEKQKESQQGLIQIATRKIQRIRSTILRIIKQNIGVLLKKLSEFKCTQQNSLILINRIKQLSECLIKYGQGIITTPNLSNDDNHLSHVLNSLEQLHQTLQQLYVNKVQNSHQYRQSIEQLNKLSIMLLITLWIKLKVDYHHLLRQKQTHTQSLNKQQCYYDSQEKVVNSILNLSKCHNKQKPNNNNKNNNQNNNNNNNNIQTVQLYCLNNLLKIQIIRIQIKLPITVLLLDAIQFINVELSYLSSTIRQIDRYSEFIIKILFPKLSQLISLNIQPIVKELSNIQSHHHQHSDQNNTKLQTIEQLLKFINIFSSLLKTNNDNFSNNNKDKDKSLVLLVLNFSNNNKQKQTNIYEFITGNTKDEYSMMIINSLFNRIVSVVSSIVWVTLSQIDLQSMFVSLINQNKQQDSNKRSIITRRQTLIIDLLILVSFLNTCSQSFTSQHSLQQLNLQLKLFNNNKQGIQKLYDNLLLLLTIQSITTNKKLNNLIKFCHKPIHKNTNNQYEEQQQQRRTIKQKQTQLNKSQSSIHFVTELAQLFKQQSAQLINSQLKLNQIIYLDTFNQQILNGNTHKSSIQSLIKRLLLLLTKTIPYLINNSQPSIIVQLQLLQQLSIKTKTTHQTQSQPIIPSIGLDQIDVIQQDLQHMKEIIQKINHKYNHIVHTQKVTTTKQYIQNILYQQQQNQRFKQSSMEIDNQDNNSQTNQQKESLSVNQQLTNSKSMFIDFLYSLYEVLSSQF